MVTLEGLFLGLYLDISRFLLLQSNHVLNLIPMIQKLAMIKHRNPYVDTALMSTSILSIQHVLFHQDAYRYSTRQFLCIVHDSCTCYVP